MKLNLLTDCNWQNQVALVRVDYNVPLVEKKGVKVVSDPRRLQASFATIKKLLSQGNKVVLLSHFGRPQSAQDSQFSLQPVFRYLQQHTDWFLQFIDHYDDPTKTRHIIDQAPAKTVFLLENLRFHPEEKQNSPKFAKLLAKLGDVYVNDAFSASHRAHASVVGLPKLLPSAAGLALEAEINAFARLMENPVHPFIVVVGGAKISDKIDPIVNLAKIADTILIGGGVANNFLKAVGLAVQKSYLQDVPADQKKEGLSYIGLADQIIEDNLDERFLKDGYIPLPKIIYPTDVVAAQSLQSSKGDIVQLTSNSHICQQCDQMYLDIGPKTIRLYKELILQAKTVFWNGPMGVYENKSFSRGTKEIARAVAKTKAVTIVGGGDTIAALDKFGVYNSVDYVSMAGSAALEFLSGKQLPGLVVLENSHA